MSIYEISTAEKGGRIVYNSFFVGVLGQVSRIYITGKIFETSRDKSWSHSYVYHTEENPPAVDKHSYMGEWQG